MDGSTPRARRFVRRGIRGHRTPVLHPGQSRAGVLRRRRVGVRAARRSARAAQRLRSARCGAARRRRRYGVSRHRGRSKGEWGAERRQRAMPRQCEDEHGAGVRARRAGADRFRVARRADCDGTRLGPRGVSPLVRGALIGRRQSSTNGSATLTRRAADEREPSPHDAMRDATGGVGGWWGGARLGSVARLQEERSRGHAAGNRRRLLPRLAAHHVGAGGRTSSPLVDSFGERSTASSYRRMWSAPAMPAAMRPGDVPGRSRLRTTRPRVGRAGAR